MFTRSKLTQLLRSSNSLRRSGLGDVTIAHGQSFAKPILVILLAISANGCASRPVLKKGVLHSQRHRIEPTASIHQALPTGGFGTSVQSSVSSVPETAIDPTETFASPPPKVVRQLPTVAAKTDIVQAWDQFENPHLRILQETALRTSVHADEIVARLSESAEYGGIGLGRNQMRNSNDAQRLLVQRVAEAFVDIRMYQQLLTDFYLQLKVQKDALAYAEQRKEDGKSGKLDVIALSSQIEFTESAMSPVRSELREAFKTSRGFDRPNSYSGNHQVLSITTATDIAKTGRTFASKRFKTAM